MRDDSPLAMAVPATVVPLPRPRASPAEEAELEIAEEQLAYAGLLDRGMKLGLLGLVATFTVYAAGLLAPRTPVAELPALWSLPVKEYLARTGIEPGWAWARALGYGDVLNFAGIAFLSAVTIGCYLAVIPIFFRKKDPVYGWLGIVEVAVLALAASGLLNAGGH